MLYLLRHIEGPDLFYLLKDKEYVVGRKNTDIVITNDQSISRRHAIIKVTSDAVTLKDCESKYGTFHNEKKIRPNNEITVKDQDLVKFGVFQSTYKMEKMSIITTGSGLTNDQKYQLKMKLASIGGTLLANWDKTCFNVTTQETMLTVKVLHALIDGKPIVTLQYWDHFVTNIKGNKPPPNPDDFKPPVAETLINRVNLEPNPERRVLFKNKVFVFPTEKIKNRMCDLIEKTGGSSISWEKEPLTLLQVTKSQKAYLFIHSDENKSPPQSLREIYKHLTDLGERTIPIQEIAMAIVLCSCEKDCNPKFNRIHSVFMDQPVDSCESRPFHLACETPSDDLSFEQSVPKRELIVPASLDEDLQMITQSSPVKQLQPASSQPRVENNPFAASSSKQTQSSVVNNPFAVSRNKRTEREPDSESAKRIKLDNSQASTSQLTTTTLTSPTNTQSKKRKAAETIEPASKKSTLKANPFTVLRNKVPTKKTSEDNPFAALRVRKDSTLESDNPFKRTIEQSPKSIQNESVHVKSNQSSLSESRLSRYSATETSNLSWISNRSCEKGKEIDPEFRAVFEEFKNITIVETVANSSIIYLSPRHICESSNPVPGRKNFKKFKKSKPRHSQTTIISLVLHETSKENNASTYIPSDDEEEEVRRPVMRNRRRFEY